MKPQVHNHSGRGWSATHLVVDFSPGGASLRYKKSTTTELADMCLEQFKWVLFGCFSFFKTPEQHRSNVVVCAFGATQ